MTSFKSAAIHDIQGASYNFSAKALVDLALLSEKKLLFLISKNQYIELLGSFGFFLHHKKVLLAGENITKSAPSGFYSTHRRLMDKFSSNVFLGFKGVSLVLCEKNTQYVHYTETVNEVKIDVNTTFSGLVGLLEGCGYSRSSKVEEIKQFCIKGGIVDFYSPIHPHPVRAYFYDKKTSFLFYNLVTGLPKKEPLKTVSLIQQNKKEVDKKIQPLLKSFGFTLININNKHNKQFKAKITEINENDFIQNKKNAIYKRGIHFSAFRFNKKIYAPLHYQDIAPNYNNSISLPAGFEKGDLVCHEDFGVGRFMGLIGFDGKEDLVKIQYLDGVVNLAVKHLFKLSFVSRETGQEQNIGSLNKRGVWKRRSSLLQKNAEVYVDSLVNMYTNKPSFGRPPFLFGGDIETSFVNRFQYAETKDQAVVWGEIKKDLEGPSPMSRLLCGDVGFGKTELAVRAVFRVVVNGGRAIVLCPTSVLVNQHLKAFNRRLSPFGVNVNVLLGGANTKTKNNIKAGWLDKKIDVLISTTASLYDDVFVKFASFFVVDEEHRFGVKQKEVLVNKFVNKDVLFMSATPIPRTLHLGLSGIHNISTLSSPPILRKPINTVVAYFSKELIKQGVLFELSRGGQVFFLHNRVDRMLSVRSLLLRLCPGVGVGVVHSQLGAKKASKVIQDFANKKYKILLCSSIIGSGIDIPNANTIFIDNSHLFGLSQLHQIRGRVGRGEVQAFAYLLIPKNKTLSIVAQKRLKTIERHTSLGSGYDLSKSDLEIRGGGAVFGYKQSGLVCDVGYEHYSKIVSRCFHKKTKQTNILFVDSFSYQVPFLCRLSEKYIPLNYERLSVYRELFGLYSVSDIGLFKKRLQGVYGPLSLEEKNLINMRLLAVLCFEVDISSVIYKNRKLNLFFNNTFIGLDYLIKFLKLYKDRFCVFDFNFEVVLEKTVLVMGFIDGFKIDSRFLLDLIGELNGFCKK